LNKLLLNLDNLNQQSRSKTVFFVDYRHIVYQAEGKIIFADCGGTELASTACPKDYKLFECLENGPYIIILINKKHFFVYDKYDEKIYSHEMNLGECISEIYPFSGENEHVIIATKQGRLIQMVRYDIINQKRIAQSASFEFSKLTAFAVEKNISYSVFNDSLVICCNMETGEKIWTRFETGKISRSIKISDGSLTYVCQSNIRSVKDGKATTSRLFNLSATDLLDILGNRIYVATNRKNIAVFQSRIKQKGWEIIGNDIIEDFIVAQGIQDNKKYDILIAQIKETVKIINLSLGVTLFSLGMPGIYRIRQTRDHLLINCHNDRSEFIPSREENLDYDLY